MIHKIVFFHILDITQFGQKRKKKEEEAIYLINLHFISLLTN